ncbi:MAG: hypothetical protein WAW86_05710 [Gammaproteobacteria bacterium]
MSTTRQNYIFRTGALNIDSMIPALNAFIEKYRLSLDILRAQPTYNEHILSITLWLFVGPTYVDSNEFLDMNPAFSFLNAISEAQKEFIVHNNDIDLHANLQLPYLSRTFTITDENAHGLGREIEDHLKENDHIPDKKYFLAKLEHNLHREKWSTKGVGIAAKEPANIKQLKDVFTHAETDENTKFNRVEEIVASTDLSTLKGFNFFSFIFRGKEVDELYATLKEQILAIRKKEAAMEQQPRTTMEMDVIHRPRA